MSAQEENPVKADEIEKVNEKDKKTETQKPTEEEEIGKYTRQKFYYRAPLTGPSSFSY